MSKRSLIPLTMCATLVLVAINLLMGFWSHRLPYFHLLEKVRSVPHANLLIVGNSMLASLDESALMLSANRNGADFRPLNSSIPGSSPPEHQLMFDYASKSQPDLNTVVVGIFDFQLTSVRKYTMSELVGNRMISIDRRFPFAEVASAYDFDLWDKVQLGGARIFPMFANRASAWKYVELCRRSMAGMGMSVIATNDMGRVDDFNAIEAHSPSAFDEEANAFLNHPSSFNPSYESLFQAANRKGMRIIVIIMPMSPHHRSLFYSRPRWKQYLDALRILAAKRNLEIIDASDRFPDEINFRDHLHLSRAGMGAFSAQLGSYLSEPAVTK